jgi:DNA-directed RNA polymerase subunit RPC12/RpoP
MKDPDIIIVFGKFKNSIDAHIVKSKLDAYGIPCFLTEESLANLYPGASSLMNSNVRLHLFQYDAERAQQIMGESNLTIQKETVLECPACRSHNIERDFPKKLNSTFITSLQFLFFGIFFPEKKVYRCADCEFEF